MLIIIVGGGEVGYALARALAPRHDVFVVDHDPMVADRFAPLDVEFVGGSGTSDVALERAGVSRCELFVACTGQDEVNIVACATATRLGAQDTICFVSRDDFVRTAGNADILREKFGIRRILWPEAQLADDIERIVAAPGAIDAEVFAEGQVRLLEYRLSEGSPFTSAPLSDLGLPHGTLVVAVKQRDRVSIPRGTTRLTPGDKVIVMGTPGPMRQLQAWLHPEQASRRGRLVTIVGGGDVGFRLAQRLEQTPGIELKVVERDARRGEFLASTLSRALVLNGDGTDLELLEAEQIGRSDVLVSVIDNDERNLLASLIGRQLGVRTVITRVSKPANLRLFERVGIDVAISAQTSAIASVIHQVEGGRATLLAVLEEGQGKVLEVPVPAGATPTKLQDLGAPAESIVGTILRGKQVIVPRGKDVIRPGDRLIVFCTAASVELVRDFFEATVGSR
jgi:trk system potassium uptake protein